MFELFKKNSGQDTRIAELEKRVNKLEKKLNSLSEKEIIESDNKKNKKAKKETVTSTVSNDRVKELEKQAKERKAENKEKIIAEIMEKTGWSHKRASSQVKDARKRCGITTKEYNEYEFYNIPVEEQTEKYEEIKAEIKKEKAAKRAKKNDGYIQTVMDASGWDRETAIAKMNHSKKMMGVSYEHYSIYRFWELTDEEQKEYFCKGDADLLREKYNTNKEILRIFMNKDLFCKNFDKFLGRPWLGTEHMELDEFKKVFGGYNKLIYKPRAMSGGHGIEVFEYDDTTIEELYHKLSSMPVGIIEGYVVQHEEMKKLSLNCVNTIRVVTIQTFDDVPGVEKGKVNFVYAGLRMGQGNSHVDNLHSGGMIAVINMDTGIVETDAVNFANHVFKEHPDTKVTIKGFKIPYFEEMKKMIEEAGKDIPGYFGWDVAITENGPIIIEMNTHPGADGLQTPYIPEKKGVRCVVEKYLGEPSPLEDEDDRVPETPYGTKISAIMKEGIEFYWKKLEVADGYEVYRSYQKEGPFERIAVIEKRSIGTYIDADFDHSKKEVYYTVCSFVESKNGTRKKSILVEAKPACFREEMVIEREATYMYSGSERSIRAFVGWGEPENTEWSSDNEEVATITSEGIIKAIATGECTISCLDKDTGKSASAKVVVNRKACEPLTEIESKYYFDKEANCWDSKENNGANDAVLMMVGDMMCGKRQMLKQYSEETGWNFNDSYEYVKDITKTADFSIGNLETLLAAGWPYMLDETYIDNMNNCNATSRYLDAVRYGGFDAVVMANNHNCDGGTKAVEETLEQVEKYELAHTGLFADDSEDRFFLANVNGIKVGFVSYISKSTGFNGKDANWSEEEKERILNIFTAEKAARDIQACKAAGAEYVIAYMHWGYKNFRNVVKHQYEEAQAVADAGADYIVGSNPHVVQAYDEIVAEDGRVVPCAYSIGNFQAVMKQVKGNRDSVIMRIRLKKDEQGKVQLVENNYIPCYTYTTCGNSSWAPVSVNLNMNMNAIRKNRKSIRARIVETVGDKIKPYK